MNSPESQICGRKIRFPHAGAADPETRVPSSRPIAANGIVPTTSVATIAATWPIESVILPAPTAATATRATAIAAIAIDIATLATIVAPGGNGSARLSFNRLPSRSVARIELEKIVPMVAKPGDPTYGVAIAALGEIEIDIAYAGSCTAGKERDLDFYARVLREALESGRRVASGVRMLIQFGSESVSEYARAKGYLELFAKAGVEVIEPGCGACIGCGPGVSDRPDQVTVSAINRNFAGRSGPGKLYLASPLTVAASAIQGKIVAYEPGMFRQPVGV